MLLADFDALRSWRGSFEEPGDYDRACEALGDGSLAQMEVGTSRAVVWDFGGPGTADIVHVSPAHVSIVRLWPDDSWTNDDCEQAAIAAATERFGANELARLSIHSGYLLALWAPEDMSAGGNPSGESGVPDDLSIGDGGAYVQVPVGNYTVTACEWQTDVCEVTKVDLKLQP